MTNSITYAHKGVLATMPSVILPSTSRISSYQKDRLVSQVVAFERRQVLRKVAEESGYELLENPTSDEIRTVLESAGNQMGSVHFVKRSDGSLRKMSYRLHVRNPSVAAKPKGVGNRKATDGLNEQLTVFDVNKVIRKDGEVIGRGAWRTIPLRNVTRIVAGGKKYIVVFS